MFCEYQHLGKMSLNAQACAVELPVEEQVQGIWLCDTGHLHGDKRVHHHNCLVSCGAGHNLLLSGTLQQPPDHAAQNTTITGMAYLVAWSFQAVQLV